MFFVVKDIHKMSTLKTRGQILSHLCLLTSTEKELLVSELPTRGKYKTRDISNVALASIRHHTGLREAAEIASAAWIDAGLISQEDSSLVIDHNELRRAQEKVMSEISDQQEKRYRIGGKILCLHLVDLVVLCTDVWDVVRDVEVLLCC
ncbi:Hypothetical predicted protein [Octopus vulgaris]|uniref:Uncharacterized protein n=1 Tax=Octopus vulgaris TaxID=6645 RepID=A0AA36B9I9_OCTVU|nr:Hypothetical predicted protein [Octopus vulgaris]